MQKRPIAILYETRNPDGGIAVEVYDLRTHTTGTLSAIVFADRDGHPTEAVPVFTFDLRSEAEKGTEVIG